MFDYESKILASKLIKDEALYLGIFDYDSPANNINKWDDLMNEAKKNAGKESWQTLFYFNGAWFDLADKGQLLSWITLFHGVFRVELRLIAENPQIDFKESEKKHFLGERKVNRLFCPSGKIVVASLSDLGKDWISPAANIEPGWYKVAFSCDNEKETDHYFLEDELQYPIDDGPDWVIYMQREN